jgi:hypothetical protein
MEVIGRTMELSEAQVVTALKRAEQIVDRAGTAADLRGAALVATVIVLTSSDTPLGPPATGLRQEVPAGAEAAQPKSAIGSLQTAATGLGVRLEDLEAVAAVGADGPYLLVPASVLLTASIPAMRQLVVLLATIRQAGRWDMAETDAALLRESLLSTHRGKFDTKNYTNALNGMDRQVSKRNAGGKVMLRVLPGGFTVARDLVNAIVAPAKEPKK